jgi:ribosomal protein S18 acetylase RimI-like enzyme
MFKVWSGTREDVKAASVFLHSNGLIADPVPAGNAGAPDALFALAAHRGRVVGVARGGQARECRGAGGAIPGRFHINTVLVDAAFRRAGVGRTLVARLLSDARARGFSSAQLWVHTENASAWALYQRFGFVAVGAVVEDEDLGTIQQMFAALEPEGG